MPFFQPARSSTRSSSLSSPDLRSASRSSSISSAVSDSSMSASKPKQASSASMATKLEQEKPAFVLDLQGQRIPSTAREAQLYFLMGFTPRDSGTMKPANAIIGLG